MKLKEIDAPYLGPDSHNCKAFVGKNGILVMHSDHGHPDFGLMKHVSISKQDEYPTWDEIMEVKLHFFGDFKDAMMMMPKRENYVNLHNNCFHLYSCPEHWKIK